VELAIKHGIDGVVISNHGGRQLDGMPSTLDALRVCAPVARGRIPITIDGGIRRGSDIFKALALGASYCFLGRIPIWGLAVCLLLPSDIHKECRLIKSSMTDKKVLNWRSRFCAKS
jgi:(S)-2-hydroxy-acid oxidase